MNDRRVLILGYGNPGRQDDGLGPAIAEAVAAWELPNVMTDDPYQLNIEDAAALAEHDLVVFVDASVDAPAPYSLTRIAPAAAITFAAPTANFSNPSGGYLFTELGCDASSCSYRFGFVPPGPGTFDAHVEIGVAGVAIVNGGLLGSLLTLLYPLAADMINAYLVYDVTGKAVVLARPQPVPGPDARMIAMLVALLALAGSLALAGAKDQRRQDSGR